MKRQLDLTKSDIETGNVFRLKIDNTKSLPLHHTAFLSTEGRERQKFRGEEKRRTERRGAERKEGQEKKML